MHFIRKQISEHGSHRKLEINIKDFSRTFKHLIKFSQDHYIFIDSDFNTTHPPLAGPRNFRNEALPHIALIFCILRT